MTDTLTRGRKALKRIQERNEEERWIYGTVGRLVDGVAVFDVTGRAGYIFVTIRQSNGSQTSPPARNDGGVPKALGLPVRLRREGTTYIVDGVTRRGDLTYTSPGQDPKTHLHDSRYFTETEITGAADLGAPADTDKLVAVRAGGLGSILWSAVKTALNVLYLVKAGLSGGQTVYGGTGSGDDLTLNSTAHATKGDVRIAAEGGNVIIGDGAAAADYMVELSKAAGPKFAMSDPGLAHGVTDLAQTDTFLLVEQLTDDNGGARITGFSDDAGLTPLRMVGVFGVTDPTNTIPAFWMLGAKRSGTTTTALAVDETVLAISNNGTNRFIVKGHGHTSIGAHEPAAMLDILQTVLNASVLRLGSPATNDDPTWDHHQGRIATTAATVTTLFQIVIPAAHLCLIDGYVMGFWTGGASGATNDFAIYEIRGAFVEAAGAAVIGFQNVVAWFESQPAWDCVFDVNGASARIRVTGAASNNITWHAHLNHRFFST